MEYRTMIFALVVVLLIIQLGLGWGAIAGNTKINTDIATTIFPVLVLVGTVALYSMKESKSGVDIEPPKFNLS